MNFEDIESGMVLTYPYRTYAGVLIGMVLAIAIYYDSDDGCWYTMDIAEFNSRNLDINSRSDRLEAVELLRGKAYCTMIYHYDVDLHKRIVLFDDVIDKMVMES